MTVNLIPGVDQPRPDLFLDRFKGGIIWICGFRECFLVDDSGKPLVMDGAFVPVGEVAVASILLWNRPAQKSECLKTFGLS